MWWIGTVIALLVAVNATDDELSLIEILPTMGPTSGNTRVTVWADGISPDAHYPDAKCRFGTAETDIVKAVVSKCTKKPKTVDDPDPLNA
jgi:hypothetical protein